MTRLRRGCVVESHAKGTSGSEGGNHTGPGGIVQKFFAQIVNAVPLKWHSRWGQFSTVFVAFVGDICDEVAQFQGALEGSIVFDVQPFTQE